MFTWIKNKWHAFEAWLDNLLPGVKTKIVNVLAMVGMAATAVYSYLENVSISSLVDAKTLGIIMFVVSTLSYWLRDISKRVERNS